MLTNILLNGKTSFMLLANRKSEFKMTLILIGVSILLTVSVAVNLYLILKPKSQNKSRSQSIELQEFCSDLFAGKLGMIAVTRVDPDNILLRSPRQK